MAQVRKPFQGVINIIRFNWHFYVGAMFAVLIIFYSSSYVSNPYNNVMDILAVLIVCTTVISLLVSTYVYDFSGLYDLKWIDQNNEEQVILNINAGFDETSDLLQEKFKGAELKALDFYDPKKHTEVSIKRARKAYPPFPKTTQIITSTINFEDNSIDKIFLILSAHEIRNEEERIAFFRELKRIIKPTGNIYITEHLRDLPNFLAYNVGFLHFHSKASWARTFQKAHLNIVQYKKLNPFISNFILAKNGDTL